MKRPSGATIAAQLTKRLLGPKPELGDVVSYSFIKLDQVIKKRKDKITHKS